MQNKSRENLLRLVRLGMLSALSIVLLYLIQPFPIFAAAPFLEYDAADIPIFIAALLYGPWWGFAVTVVVSIIQGFTVGAKSGVIGIAMHIIATGAFCLASGFIYRSKKTLGRAVLALTAGVLTMTAVMVCWNLILTPIFMGAPVEMVIGMLVPVIIPFNLIKAGANAAATFVVYKPISGLFSLQGKAKKRDKSELKDIDSDEPK